VAKGWNNRQHVFKGGHDRGSFARTGAGMDDKWNVMTQQWAW